jgi:hypothetical protein
VNPTSHDFGNITVGQSSTTQTFTITNNGTANLVISSLVLSGVDQSQFVIDPPITGLSWTIIPNGTRTFNVRFLPSSIGLKNAYVAIIDNLSSLTRNPSELSYYTISRTYSSNNIESNMD